jgi:ABC-type antimicrobial peptide transport system permease subunit
VTIVGVVGNTMDGGYEAGPGETIYMPYFQIAQERLSIVAEGRTGAADALAAIRSALRKTDPVLAAGNVAALDDLVLQANALPRLRTVILIVFSLVALGVVGLGTYSVMSQLVSTRQREFALRLIFGARPTQVGRIVVLQVARITVPGIVIGLVVAALVVGALRAFLFGVEPTSIPVFAAASCLLMGFTVAATVPCAIRAMRVDARRGAE